MGDRVGFFPVGAVFRARPIDVDAPMPVLRIDDDDDDHTLSPGALSAAASAASSPNVRLAAALDDGVGRRPGHGSPRARPVPLDGGGIPSGRSVASASAAAASPTRVHSDGSAGLDGMATRSSLRQRTCSASGTAPHHPLSKTAEKQPQEEKPGHLLPSRYSPRPPSHHSILQPQSVEDQIGAVLDRPAVPGREIVPTPRSQVIVPATDEDTTLSSDRSRTGKSRSRSNARRRSSVTGPVAIQTGRACPPWPRPKRYVAFSAPSKETLDSRVEYDLDDKDDELLDHLASLGGRAALAPDLVEQLIDVFDKEGYYQETEGGIPYNEAELDIRCGVCDLGDFTDGNQIVLCDSCDLAVHQDCYGVPQVPDGNWYCRRCAAITDFVLYPGAAAAPPPPEAPASVTIPKPPRSLSSSRRGAAVSSEEQAALFAVAASNSLTRLMRMSEAAANEFAQGCECVFCPVKGGALARTKEGPWVHVVCARWTLVGGAAAGSLDSACSCGPSAALRAGAARGTRCCVCGYDYGVVVRCCAADCGLSFHAMCGRATAGYWVALDSAGRESAFCRRHARPHYDQRFACNGRWESVYRKWLDAGLWERHPRAADSVRQARAPDDAVAAVFLHWFRRRSTQRAPLLRRLQVALQDSASRVFVSSLSWDDKDEALLTAEEDEFAQLRVLRQHFERCRLLLDLVTKRERLRAAALPLERALATRLLRQPPAAPSELAHALRAHRLAHFLRRSPKRSRKDDDD